jgi:Rps23 Pro-64 3,4-dihydroxylase Tpa1-like proline 4-hydroxylase
MIVKVYDNLFDAGHVRRFQQELKHLSWTVDTYITEKDKTYDGHCQTSLDRNSTLFHHMLNVITSNIEEVQELELYDAHANCIFPRERAYFHKDNTSEGSITLLYYVNDTEFLEGGTEIYNKETHEVRSILPKAGRIVIFSGDILHRATCFREDQRFIIAYKFKRPEND